MSIRGLDLGEFALHVPGKHNVANAAAAALCAHSVGISWSAIKTGLAKFKGTKRRFEFLGEKRGVKFIDDYAHHPKEIVSTLQAAREWFPGSRLHAIFQPHTYSRTKHLLADFSASFAAADTVILTEIYASARETDTLGITGSTLALEIAKRHANVHFAPTYSEVTSKLTQLIQANDVVIFMGAGDIYNWEHTVVQQI